MHPQEYASMYKLEERHWWYVTLHGLTLSWLGKLGLAPGARVLDAGCGTGRMLSLLGGHYEASGFDYSETAVEFCRKRGLERVRREDLRQWQPEADAFDAIVSLDVLYHADAGPAEEILAKFRRALKPGGYLIVNLPAYAFLRRRHDLRIKTARRFAAGPWREELECARFEVRFMSYRLPYLFLVILPLKMAERIFAAKNGEGHSDLAESPWLVNEPLKFLGRLENACLSRGGRLPFGSSLFTVARKS